MIRRLLPLWTWLAPLATWLLIGGAAAYHHSAISATLGVAVVAAVLAAVHHAEIVAHRVGQPLGSFVLALSVTVIEVALIVELMLTNPAKNAGLPRDTVYAAIMIIVNGMVGLCLILGGTRHREQEFGLYGVNAALATLATLSVLTLILPNTTITTPGPYYSPEQLAFVGVISLVLYVVFAFVQTVRNPDQFTFAAGDVDDREHHAPPPSNIVTAIAAVLLLVALGAVVVGAEELAPPLEGWIQALGAPPAILGVIISLVVLLPEGISAMKAAFADRLQISLNLSLGSALASIGLTIPVVAALSLINGWPLALGLTPRETVLLLLSLLVAALSLGTGRTTVLQGAVHLVIFAVFLFTTIVP